MSAPAGGDGSVGPGEKPREALKIQQIQGSTAGAGSGEFHTYRKARNIERERIAKMERDAAEEEARIKFERERAIAQFHIEQATAKKAEKRKRKKAAKEEFQKKQKLEATNALPNDGSFLELFLKKQAEGKLPTTAATTSSSSTSSSTTTTTSNDVTDSKDSTAPSTETQKPEKMVESKDSD